MIYERTILAKIKMLEMGIVPATTGHELKKQMESLSESDRKVAKRKFRKIWKKYLKKNPNLRDLFYPAIGSDPTKDNLRNRAVYVVIEIVKECKN